jgi:hypothetical protein
MKIVTLLFIFCACSTISGCVTYSTLDPATATHTDIGNSSVIVMGMQPRYRVHVFKGENDGDNWLRNQVITTLNVYPEDGYIVSNVPPRSGPENYGIGGILPEGFGGDLFVPCKGRKTLTFNAPKGQVVYVGDINYSKKEDQITFTVSSDFAGAQAYLQAKYPVLAPKLVNGGFSVRELSNTPCERRMLLIPIFLR